MEKNIMASVRVIYAIRQLASAWAIKLYVAIAALYTLGRLVWVSRIFENLEKVGWNHALQFMISAVLNTHVVVQVLFAIFVIAVASFIIDSVKSLTTPAFA